MYVEMLEGRFAGQMRDIENGTALELVKLGRAKRAFGEPTQAAPIAAGGYRDTTAVPAQPRVKLPEETIDPFTSLDAVSQGTSKISFPVAKTKKGK